MRRLGLWLLLALLPAGLWAASPRVVVSAHDAGYHTSLAKHIQRWLKGEQVEAALATPATLGAQLAAAKLVFLVGYDAPTAAEVTALKAFVKRGGRLVVFHSASRELASLMGVRLTGFAKAPRPGAFSRMAFDSSQLLGCPKEILQTSTVLQRAQPIVGRSARLAEWRDRQGRSTGEAAFLRSSAGWWMTHVLLADGDEALKARLVAAMCGAVDRSLWNPVAADKRDAAVSAATRQLALAQRPVAGEIHAVWDHSGCGLYPGNWPATFKVLKSAHVTDLFVNVAGAAFAHYPSLVLPPSKTYQDEGDQLSACLAAARGTGIRVHAWVLCFTATRAAGTALADFERRGWRLKDREGRLTEYLDPSLPAVREHVLAAIGEISRGYPVAGIHLDFVRWYERSAKHPKDAAKVITDFVAAARRRVSRPQWLTAAVLGKYPTCVASVGQNWTSWLDAKLLDYAVPMDYTEDPQQLAGFLRQHAESPERAKRIIVGLGVTANESRLNARQVIGQLRQVRAYPLAGAALFDLDVTLEKQILPYLKLGIWGGR